MLRYITTLVRHKYGISTTLVRSLHDIMRVLYAFISISPPESEVVVSLVGMKALDTQKHFDFLLGSNDYSI